MKFRLLAIGLLLSVLGVLIPQQAQAAPTVLFRETFDGTSLNKTKWEQCWFENGSTCGKMNGSNGVQTLKSNVAVYNGVLRLTLKDRNSGGLVSTNPRGGASTGFQFQYGYAEASVYFQGDGKGNVYNWGAWWTNSQESPEGGENDVAEVVGTKLSTVYHGPNGNQGKTPSGDYTNKWHKYGVERLPGVTKIYWDQKLVATFNGVENDPHYLIFNNSISSSKLYKPGGQVFVDWVQVWSSRPF